jgi:hypothetical protein
LSFPCKPKPFQPTEHNPQTVQCKWL